MLNEVFSDIKKNYKSMLGSTKGSDFEQQICTKLKSFGFTQSTVKTDKILKEYIADIKTSILSKDKDTLLKNTLKDKVKGNQYINFFVCQPYGSQNFPDFLVFTNNSIFSIESKFGKNNTTKPVWNSNLPKKQGIYIFGSFGKKDVTFFMGKDVLTDKERELLLNIWNETDKSFKDWKTENKKLYKSKTIDNKHGFVPYIRKAYDQNKTINKNAYLDYFNNPDRKDYEESVIDFIKNNE